jgi:hypothetical protein
MDMVQRYELFDTVYTNGIGFQPYREQGAAADAPFWLVIGKTNGGSNDFEEKVHAACPAYVTIKVVDWLGYDFLLLAIKDFTRRWEVLTAMRNHQIPLAVKTKHVTAGLKFLPQDQPLSQYAWEKYVWQQLVCAYPLEAYPELKAAFPYTCWQQLVSEGVVSPKHAQHAANDKVLLADYTRWPRYQTVDWAVMDAV